MLFVRKLKLSNVSVSYNIPPPPLSIIDTFIGPQGTSIGPPHTLDTGGEWIVTNAFDNSQWFGDGGPHDPISTIQLTGDGGVGTAFIAPDLFEAPVIYPSSGLNIPDLFTLTVDFLIRGAQGPNCAFTIGFLGNPTTGEAYFLDCLNTDINTEIDVYYLDSFGDAHFMGFILTNNSLADIPATLTLRSSGNIKTLSITDQADNDLVIDVSSWTVLSSGMFFMYLYGIHGSIPSEYIASITKFEVGPYTSPSPPFNVQVIGALDVTGSVAVGETVIYKWIPDFTGITSLSLKDPITDFDTVLIVYASDGTTQIDFNDDYNPGLSSQIDGLNIVSGETYYIHVGSFSSSYSGNYRLYTII